MVFTGITVMNDSALRGALGVIIGRNDSIKEFTLTVNAVEVLIFILTEILAYILISAVVCKIAAERLHELTGNGFACVFIAILMR